MSIESDQHHGYNEHYEQDNSRLNASNTRPIFSNTNSTDSIQHQHQPMMPQQQSPHRLNMSSQPTTPKPSSVTSTNNSPRLDQSTPSSLPLENAKYNLVTPGTPNETNYSPHTNTIRTTAHRKDSVVPNINETCPSFGPTEYNHNVVSMDRHSIIDVRLHTKVDRGFFLAEEDWTCYRRNYFQVSGSFSLEGVGILYEGQDFPCLVKDHTGHLEEIHCFMLGVSARLSDCDKPIQLIQHTPKRDKGPQTTPTPKPIRPGGNIGFSAVGSSQSIVTFERLQFKTATANNGKRRAAQQYYVIIVELLAKLRNGNTVSIATTKSSALVVRGRSPGHYAETDSSVTHSILPRQHRASAIQQAPQQVPPPPPQQQQQHPSHVPPYGRPTAYAGASPNLFQPTEYMPYDYHGVAYTNYGHMPPHHQPQQAQQQQGQHSYPSTASPVPIMSQQQYVHDRSTSSNSNSNETTAYPNNNNNNNQEYDHDVKEEHGGHPPHSSSPYYWQRNSNNTNEQHHQEEQDHWNRMRIASNNSSSSVDNSQHGSPYMNHPPPAHHQEQQYYAQQHHHQQQQQQQQQHQQHQHQQHQQQQYASHSYAHNSHPSTQSLPPPPPPSAAQAGPDGQHYPGYNYDWQPRPKMSNTYSYESDRRHEYNERQHHETPPPPPPSTKAAIVK